MAIFQLTENSGQDNEFNTQVIKASNIQEAIKEYLKHNKPGPISGVVPHQPEDLIGIELFCEDAANPFDVVERKLSALFCELRDLGNIGWDVVQNIDGDDWRLTNDHQWELNTITGAIKDKIGQVYACLEALRQFIEEKEREERRASEERE